MAKIKSALSFAALGLGCILLVACTSSPENLSSAAGGAHNSAPSQITASISIGPEQDTPETETIAVPDISDVIGWPSDELRQTLGEATLIRRDHTAQIWQYRSHSCVLMVFLYEDAQKTTVRHVEDSNGGDTQRCLDTIVRANHAAKIG